MPMYSSLISFDFTPAMSRDARRPALFSSFSRPKSLTEVDKTSSMLQKKKVVKGITQKDWHEMYCRSLLK